MFDGEHFRSYFQSRFGIPPEFWQPYEIDVGKRTVYLRPEEGLELNGWEFEARGFRVARTTSSSYKPGNRLLQWLNRAITRNKIGLKTEELRALFRREHTVPAVEHGCSRGYVALCYRGPVVGCGFWTGEELRTQMSKGMCKEFPPPAFSPVEG